MIRSQENKDDTSPDEKIRLACHDVGEQVVLQAERTGTPVVVWRDGQVVLLSPADARSESNQSHK